MTQSGNGVVIALNGADILTMRNVLLGTLQASDVVLALGIPDHILLRVKPPALTGVPHVGADF
jgi:hypothetical protein